MTVLVAASLKDIAALNIARKLVERYGFDKITSAQETLDMYRKGEVVLAYVRDDGIYAENADQVVPAEAVIFASRHRSETGEPSLTVHCTGNLTDQAAYGGKPKTLSLAPPERMRAALLALDEGKARSGIGYSISLEATHHGPTGLGTPSMFVEIGSSEKQWRDPRAAEIVADAIWNAATSPRPGKVAVGFGGGHYSWKHTQAVRDQGYAVGHILPKYFFDEFDPEMVKLAFRRTLGDCRTGAIDWKGLRGPERSRLIDILERDGIEIVRL